MDGLAQYRRSVGLPAVSVQWGAWISGGMAAERDTVERLDAQGIKDLCFDLGNNLNNAFILFGSAQGGKALLSCYISKELVADKSLNAGQVVRELGKHIQGGGGGQPFFATAGGKNPAGITEALKAATAFLN